MWADEANVERVTMFWHLFDPVQGSLDRRASLPNLIRKWLGNENGVDDDAVGDGFKVSFVLGVVGVFNATALKCFTIARKSSVICL